jgi:hypothetical protein
MAEVIMDHGVSGCFGTSLAPVSDPFYESDWIPLCEPKEIQHERRWPFYHVEDERYWPSAHALP